MHVKTVAQELLLRAALHGPSCSGHSLASVTHQPVSPQVLFQGEPPPSLSPVACTALLNCSGLQVAVLVAG